MITPFQTGKQAVTAMEKMQRVLRGEQPTISVLEQNPELLDLITADKQVRTATPGSDVSANTRSRLNYVFHRDAKHLAASRGALWRHGLQSKLAYMLDAGDILTLNTEDA